MFDADRRLIAPYQIYHSKRDKIIATFTKVVTY